MKSFQQFNEAKAKELGYVVQEKGGRFEVALLTPAAYEKYKAGVHDMLVSDDKDAKYTHGKATTDLATRMKPALKVGRTGTALNFRTVDKAIVDELKG